MGEKKIASMTKTLFRNAEDGRMRKGNWRGIDVGKWPSDRRGKEMNIKKEKMPSRGNQITGIHLRLKGE